LPSLSCIHTPCAASAQRTHIAIIIIIKLSAVIASVSLILTAAYMLWTNQRVFYGETKQINLSLQDARKSELLVLGVLLALAIIYGIYPNFVNDIYEPQLNSLVNSLH
jgi:NADH-quinone oxidoreductase subunit M